MRSPHTLLTWTGVLGDLAAPSEQWSFSLRAAGGVTLADGSLSAAAIGLAGPYNDHIRPVMGDNIRLTETLVATVTGDGTWAKGADGQYLAARAQHNIAGGTTTPPLPAQAALCISLGTARSGPTGKGRFFLPLGRQTLGADGRLTSVMQTAYADAAMSFVDMVNDIVGEVVVASETGTLSPVTHIRVGRVVDTLRSRRRDQIEEYAFRALPS